MKTRLAIGLLVFSILCVIAVAVWHVGSRGELPKIKDAKKLRSDCVVLAHQFPLPPLNTNQMLFKELNGTNTWTETFRRRLRQAHIREIPKESWPNSIKELHPMRVTRDEYAICIWLLDRNKTTPGAKGNWVAKGYYVHTNPNESPPRSATHGFAEYYLLETQFQGIDVFELPAVAL